MRKISVIGSLNMDLIFQTERVPLAGETIAGNRFKLVPGGKGANQAVAAARAGIKTQMYGCVGSDSFGASLLSSLKEAGVDTSNIDTSDKSSTGVAAILLENSGENRIIIIPGCNDLVDKDYVNNHWQEIAMSDLIVLQHEIPMGTTQHIIEAAYEASIPVLLNPAPFYPIPDEVLRKVNYLVLNETELQGLIGNNNCSVEDLIKASKALLEKGVKKLIITLGKEGSVFLSNNIVIRQPAFSVKAIDTTAAGDTFVGYLATAIINGQDAKEALEIASAAAAIAVTKIGAQSSIPAIDETLDLVRKSRDSISNLD